MKKIIYSLMLTISVIGSGCSDFLNTDPVMKHVETNFYTNESECFQALAGCYKVLQADNYGNFYLISEILSDDCFNGAGTDGNDTWDEFKSNGEQNMFKNPWKKYNWGIHRCNLLLANIGDATFKNEKLRTQYIAETRFLRAYFYFDYIRLFGNVPLSTSGLEDNYKQAAPADVYKLIAEDLKFASDSLPTVTFDNISATDLGRVTKWSAESLLGRVFLYYTGYYGTTDLAGVITKAQATTYINDVIENSGHDLVPDFRSLWPMANLTYYTKDPQLAYIGEGKENKETIFAIKYTAEGTSEGFYDVSGSTGNTWLIYMGTRATGKMPILHGWGFCPVRPKMYNAFDNDDIRKKASMLAIKDEGVTYKTAVDQRDETYIWQKKYAPLADKDGVAIDPNWQYGNGQDYVVIRFADVLLMGAELNFGTDNIKAQADYDKVRSRAFGSKFVQKVVSKDNIMNERQYELAFEGIRYWDLLRQGLTKTKTELDASSTTVELGGATKTKTINFPLATKGLIQIPKIQIDLSAGTLVQNAGWEQ